MEDRPLPNKFLPGSAPVFLPPHIQQQQDSPVSGPGEGPGPGPSTPSAGPGGAFAGFGVNGGISGSTPGGGGWRAKHSDPSTS